MLTMTPVAQKKLKETLKEETIASELYLRILSSTPGNARFDLALDKEREGDQVVKTGQGTKLLLIGADLAPALKGRVIDYQETPEGGHFIISKRTNPQKGDDSAG